jgi:uncharacterized delta-60 repeat protein
MRIAFACLLFVLSACGGGQSPPSSSPQPPPPSGIGPAGGTVSNGGARVVVPAAALAQVTSIAIEQTDVGAPPLPAGVVAFGPMFAFTPHGTAFAVPAAVTLPYDPSRVPPGTQVELYKTGASQSSWQSVPLTSTGSNSVTADVSGFSYMVVAGTPPALAREEPDRLWIFEKILAASDEVVATEDQDGEDNHKTGGVVEDEHDYGPLPFNFNGDSNATGAVFSSETGGTYWVFAQGPKGSIKTPQSTIGNRVTLVQKQGFKKNRADARLKLHVTKVFIETIDANGEEILYPECPTSLECGLTIAGIVTLDVKAYQPFITPFFSGKSSVKLSGYQGHWEARNKVVIDGRQPLWGDVFEFENDAGGFGSQQHAIYQLKEPITIEIDISHLDVNVPFTLWVEAVAETNNHRQRESYVASFFRDPLSIEGADIETFGLDPVAGPFADPLPDQPQAPECSSGDEASAGTLQFAASMFYAPEIAQAFAQVEITRSGGRQGAVSATVRTQDDSAHAGEDYETVNTTVYFGDGDDAARVLEVPLTLDDVAESDKSLIVTLSDPRGCAVLGTPASATLTILDDDRPEPEPPPSGLDETFGSQGKTTLAGFGGESGMALQPDGKIVMVGGRFVDFVLARFNADGTVDTGFGNGGKVATDIAGGFAQERARAVAIQPDGKIVVAGESSLPSGDLAVALVRYNADGTLDAKFGTDGKVFDAPAVLGRAFDVVVLADGRIVVAGDAPVANDPSDFGDFLVARYQPNGSLDPTFGTNGIVVTDTSFGTDLARNIVVQPDGALVVSGDPIGSDPSLHTSVARYQASGALDPTFNSGGKLVLAGAHVGRGLALQSDGRLVLVGSMAVSNVPDDLTHFAAIRLKADGTFDESFGSGGTATVSITGRTDVAHAVVVQADGRIVVAGEGNLINPNFALARFNTDGTLDPSFAIDGKLEVDFAGLEDRAENVGLQPDGKIVAGGLATGRTAGYGLVRVIP